MTSNELLVSRVGRLGRIILNRPKALNSLTLGMVRSFSAALDEFGADPEILAVLVSGEGERGLCAGGDIRTLYDLRDKNKDYYKIFWREEYQLNARIASFPKFFIVIMDGLVMGGGVGISAHGNRRLVTERTRIAMPETGIGFIPDVGGTWLLTRNGGAGVYMALSGAAVTATDAIHIGLADMAIRSQDAAELERRLSTIVEAKDVDAILRTFEEETDEGIFERNKTLLDTAMAHSRVEEIIGALYSANTEFAVAAAIQISQKSPTSLKVTRALLSRAAAADRLETCLTNEFRAACSLLHSHDLYEGIRAAVIDKDRNPKWSPATLAEVDERTVAEILRGDGDQEPVFRAWAELA